MDNARATLLARDLWIAGYEAYCRESPRPDDGGSFLAQGWDAAERDADAWPEKASGACPIGAIDHTGYVAVRVGRRWCAVYVDQHTKRARVQTRSRYFFRTGIPRMTITGSDLRAVATLSRWSDAMTFSCLGDLLALHPGALRYPDGDSPGRHPCSGIVPAIALEHRKGA